jgi:hypothetical protein
MFNPVAHNGILLIVDIDLMGTPDGFQQGHIEPLAAGPPTFPQKVS